MLAALLAAAAASVAPPAMPAPPTTAAAAPPVASPDDPEANAAALRRLYDQSCHNRAYGSFDDMCEAMGRQIHEYDVQARKAARIRRVRSAPTPSAPG